MYEFPEFLILYKSAFYSSTLPINFCFKIFGKYCYLFYILGWRGSHCENPCESNKYGKDCKESCDCQNNGDCNPINGSCNCVPGFLGLK